MYVPRQEKTKVVKHRQTSTARNVKETSLGRRDQNYNKMIITTFAPKNTLNVNGFNASIKRPRMSEWIIKKDPTKKQTTTKKPPLK